ncbi:hypothetical protein FHS26_005774 [Rhizobium pisi]|uniref:Uncharacterized protein n=2 Tax=Rhizobium TaxID=379 RepID=A0A7W6FL85_9HYPH|nr:MULTISPECIES: hypothetical protein [Rhizobium]MBB3138004.1 hypothetical protein [Rhizobium pisi]MBB3917902.1 hypothetical protein [Rhizobium fabae]TCA52656.1 hypothetical protein E0J16_19770 [Rhizobium pisi]
MTVVELFRQSLQFPCPLPRRHPIEGDDAVQTNMPASSPSPLSTAGASLLGIAGHRITGKKIKKSSQTLLRFCRDPHRSRPPTRRADAASFAMGD